MIDDLAEAVAGGSVRQLWRPAALFLGGRAVVYAAVFMATRVSVHALTTGPGHRPMGSSSMLGTLGEWDGAFWVRAATAGYPHHLPGVHGHPGPSTVAFFPGYPLLVRALYRLTSLPPADAALIVSGVAGLVATLALWAFANRYWGRSVADRSTALFCVFPGSLVFSMAYSEGLLLVAVIGCVWALTERRWVWAGLAGLVGTATHPNGIGLAALCVLAAIVAISRRRDWGALVAPALSSVGVAAFVVFLRIRTGSWLAWPDTERSGWHDRADFLGIPRHLSAVVHGHYGLAVLVGISTLSVVVGLWWAHQRRLRWLLTGWIVLAALPAVASDSASLRPRMVIVAFPIFIAAALALSRRAYLLAIAVSIVMLFAVSMYILTSLSVSP